MKQPFSILIDESMSLSKKSNLIVYIRSTLDVAYGPITLLMSLIELNETNDEGITGNLLECLRKFSFTQEMLLEHWLGFASDGASVMLGKKAGVYALLKKQYPKLIGWHCLSHRLELSVHNAVKAYVQVNCFKVFMNKLYSLYSMSPKHKRSIERCAAELGTEIRKIGKILNVRWIASSFRSVSAVWNNSTALYKNFMTEADDTANNSKERAQFSGLAK